MAATADAINLVLLIPSCALAALLGFVAHRAGICTVKVVEEVLTTGRVFLLQSFGKTILWIMLVTSLLLCVLPATAVSITGWRASAAGVAGGIVFGIGAVLNGGCAISTLTRLSSGQLAMAATVVGMALGVLAHSTSIEHGLVNAGAPAAALLSDAAIPLLLPILSLWAASEARRLWRARPTGSRMASLAISPRYSLSAAALLIGVSNALLYALHGRWAYTGALGGTVDRLVSHGTQPAVAPAILALAMFVGMLFSAMLSKSLLLRWSSAGDWFRHGVGGLLMGFGAALAPGGNDELLLHSIPILSPHALPVFIAMLGGIWLTLVVFRFLGRGIRIVDCRGDMCRG